MMSKETLLAAPPKNKNIPRIGIINSGLCFFSHSLAGSEASLLKWEDYDKIEARISAGGGTTHNAIVQYAQMQNGIDESAILSRLEVYNQTLRRTARTLNPAGACIEDVMSARTPFEACANWGRHMMLYTATTAKAGVNSVYATSDWKMNESNLYILRECLEEVLPSSLTEQDVTTTFANYGTALHKEDNGNRHVRAFENPSIDEILCGSAFVECGGTRHPTEEGIFFDAGPIGNPPILGDGIDFSVYDFIDKHGLSDLLFIIGPSNSADMRDLPCGMQLGEIHDDYEAVRSSSKVRTHLAPLDLDAHWDIANQTLTSPQALKAATRHACQRMGENLQVIVPNMGVRSTEDTSEPAYNAA